MGNEIDKNKKELINDIEQLLNSYEGLKPTHINPDILKYMDQESLKSIIKSLLHEKEKVLQNNLEWLETFKKY